MLMVFVEPQDTAYRQLMEYTVKKSDAIMLAFVDYDYSTEIDYQKRKMEFREKLAPYRIKTRTNATWPSNTSLDRNAKFNVDVYRSCDALLRFLYEADGLFKWHRPKLPEDPCFFLNGECWFGVSGHEKYAFFNDCRENRELLKELGIEYEVIPENGKSFKEDYKIK